jgi:glycogen operon protein
MSRSQGGNNNAWCQDSDISWFDWEPLEPHQEDILGFTRRLIALRRRHPVLRRKLFFYGRAIYSSDVKDLTWLRPDGREMTETDWQNAGTRAFGLRLAGDAIEELDERGERIVDDTFLILINGFWEPLSFVLPAHKSGVRWEPVLDTREAANPRRGRVRRGGQSYDMEARSLVVFRQG